MANIDVDHVRFSPVRLREGYDMGEVDQHLDLVKATLAALDAAVAGTAPLPGVIPTPRFTPVRLREGYDMGEVDAFLDQVTAEEARLRSLAGHGIIPTASPVAPPPVDPSAPAYVAAPAARPTHAGAAAPLVREHRTSPVLPVVALVLAVALVVAIAVALLG